MSLDFDTAGLPTGSLLQADIRASYGLLKVEVEIPLRSSKVVPVDAMMVGPSFT
jgi:hypothetical protein